MAPSLAAHSPSDASDNEDVAPESVTLIQSKQQAKQLEEARQAAESEAKRRRKERNKQIDENLKKRAVETRGENSRQSAAKADKSEKKQKASSPEDEEAKKLEDRMARAMQEAEEEEGDEEEAWGGFGDDTTIGAGSDHEQESAGVSAEDGSSGEDDASMDGVSEDDEPANEEPTKDAKLDYLPEHLFFEALSKARTPAKQIASSTTTKPSVKLKSEQKRKPGKKRSTKDIVLGPKVIRTLPQRTAHISTAASRTLPPGKVRRFYEDRLNLRSKRGGKSRGTWDRKAANIGIMRSSTLPAANFVRNG